MHLLLFKWVVRAQQVSVGSISLFEASPNKCGCDIPREADVGIPDIINWDSQYYKQRFHDLYKVSP